MSNTNNKIESEKVNPRTKKLVETINGTCSICDRNKSKHFTKYNEILFKTQNALTAIDQLGVIVLGVI